VKVKFPDATDNAIQDRIGRFLAQAADREGGRKNRISCAARRSSEEPNADVN